MDRALQTKEWFQLLKKKTTLYTRNYVEKFYKQWRHSGYTIDDLVNEFILDWLTPRDGRHHDRPMQTWPDRFDPETMNLDSCLKCMIIRKLIDKSKMDKKRMYSLDEYVEEKGESFYDLESLISRQVNVSDTHKMEMALAFDRLGPKTKQTVIDEYLTIRGDIPVDNKDLFDKILGIKPLSVMVDLQKKPDVDTDDDPIVDESVSDDESLDSVVESTYVNASDVVPDTTYVDSVVNKKSRGKRCYIQAINQKTITAVVDGEFLLFDRFSGVDKGRGVYSIDEKDLMDCDGIKSWKYSYVPKEEFIGFVSTLEN